jgi:hypothetical protein
VSDFNVSCANLARVVDDLPVDDGVDLADAYQAWLDWYNADKEDEVGSLSHELARKYVLALILELRICRRDHSTGKQDSHE